MPDFTKRTPLRVRIAFLVLPLGHRAPVGTEHPHVFRALFVDLGQDTRESFRGEIAHVEHVGVDLRFESRIRLHGMQQLQRALHLQQCVGWFVLAGVRGLSDGFGGVFPPLFAIAFVLRHVPRGSVNHRQTCGFMRLHLPHAADAERATRAIGAAEIEIVFRGDKSDHALGNLGKDDAYLLFRGLIRQRAVIILPQAVDEVRHLIA